MALSTKLCFALIVSGCFITRTSRTQLLDKGTPNERQTDTSDNQTEERSKRSLPTLLGKICCFNVVFKFIYYTCS